MPVRIGRATMEEIQELFSRGAIGTWTDGELIAHYLSAEANSEAAFRVLIERHGPMVLGVCRRISGNEHAAEDAFQATFLVLVKKARTLRDRGLLAKWLYGVALKISHKERKRAERRRTVERRAAERKPLPGDHSDADELRSLVTEEITRLPDRYRMPLWLCYIEGLAHHEAAQKLGCPVGTVESRLSRARDRLRQRLARRGLAAPSMAIAALPGQRSIGRLTAGLVESTLQVARNASCVGPASLVAGRVLWGWKVQAAAGITLGACASAAGLAIALGLVEVGPKPRVASQAPIVAVEHAAATAPAAQPENPKAAPPKLATGNLAGSTARPAEHPSGRAVARLVEQLRRRTTRRSTKVGQVGLYLIEAGGGDSTLIANEPAEGLNQCGSPVWSHDGRRIVFDATPSQAVGQADFRRSRLCAIELDGDRLLDRDRGPGNCPDFSPEDDQMLFLLNAAPASAEADGVWLMGADGSRRRPLGNYGRPKWSPQGRQLMITSFSSPATVTVVDFRPRRSRVLNISGHQIFSVPSWVSEGTIVAVLGSAGGPGDTIALVDVTDPAHGQVKEVLWKSADAADVLPYAPIYSPVTRRCTFIGKTPGKGRALYSFEPGDPGRPRRLESKDSFDNLIQDPIFSPDGRFIVFSSDRKPHHSPGEETLEPGNPGRPLRLESKGFFDNLIQDPIFSPDGRLIVFSSDRKPHHSPGEETLTE